MREAVLEEGAMSSFWKEEQGRRRQRTMNKSLELTDFSSLLRLISFPSLSHFISFRLSTISLSLSLSVCLLLKVATWWWEAAMWWQHNRWESRRWEAGFKFSPDRTQNTLEYQQPCVLTHRHTGRAACPHTNTHLTRTHTVQYALELQIRWSQVRVDKFKNRLELWTCACIASCFWRKSPKGLIHATYLSLWNCGQLELSIQQLIQCAVLLWVLSVRLYLLRSHNERSLSHKTK